MPRPEDIDLESGIDVFRIRGDATKTDGYRNVPIHDHLIEQGFLEHQHSEYRRNGRRAHAKLSCNLYTGQAHTIS